MLELADSYNDQKELLEKVQQREEMTDAFICSVMASRHKDSNEVTTFTIWAKD